MRRKRICVQYDANSAHQPLSLKVSTRKIEIRSKQHLKKKMKERYLICLSHEIASSDFSRTHSNQHIRKLEKHKKDQKRAL